MNHRSTGRNLAGMLLLVAGLALAGCMDQEDAGVARDLGEARERLEDARELAREARHERTAEALRKAREARERAEEALDRARERRRSLSPEQRRALDDAWEAVDDARREARSAWKDAVRTVDESLDDDFDDALDDLGEGLKRLGRAFEQSADLEPVDWRDLRDLLPDRLAGMERTSVDGETSEALGLHVSSVEVEYESDDADLTVHLVDLGSLSGVVSEGLDWLDARVDKGGDWGYERSTTYHGYSAFEKMHRDRRETRLETQILVGDRFVVAIEMEGRGLDEDALDAVREAIDLDRLAHLAR